MRSAVLFSALAASTTVAAAVESPSSPTAAAGDNISDTSPFLRALYAADAPQNRNLFDRQTNNNNCPTGSGSCSGIGYAGYCCLTGSSCALDNSNHIACCPSGIFCSGSVPTVRVTTIAPTTTLTGTGTGTTVLVAGAALSTVYDGASQVISVLTTQYADFRSDLGGWYTGFTQRYGSGYTSFLNAQGQYVTTVQEVVGGVATQVPVTVVLPVAGFVQAGTTATVTVRSSGGDGGKAAGRQMGALSGLVGVFVAVVGWL